MLSWRLFIKKCRVWGVIENNWTSILIYFFIWRPIVILVLCLPACLMFFISRIHWPATIFVASRHGLLSLEQLLPLGFVQNINTIHKPIINCNLCNLPPLWCEIHEWNHVLHKSVSKSLFLNFKVALNDFFIVIFLFFYRKLSLVIQFRGGDTREVIIYIFWFTITQHMTQVGTEYSHHESVTQLTIPKLRILIIFPFW